MSWTIPNMLTVCRLAVTPAVAIVFLILPRPLADWIALVMFVLAAVTDFLDGYLARLWKQESLFGRMLDPVADKAMVVIALLVLVALAELSAWVTIPAVVIIFREILVSGLREFAGGQSQLLSVTGIARWKTTVQMVAVAGLFLSTGLGQVPDPGKAQGAAGMVAVATSAVEVVALTLLWVAAVMTLTTGWGYFVKAISGSPGDG